MLVELEHRGNFLMLIYNLIKKALNAGYELMSPLKNIVGKINFPLNFQVGFNFHSSVLKASST